MIFIRANNSWVFIVIDITEVHSIKLAFSFNYELVSSSVLSSQHSNASISVFSSIPVIR
jgi:hypothetical protein